jgi:two-component system, cell cycle response regulator
MLTRLHAESPPLIEVLASTHLPSPSGVALALARLCSQESAPLPEITQLLRADPALTGRLLKMVNASRSGLARPVTSIPDAVNLLGLGNLARLAIGISVLESTRSGFSQRFDFGRFWSRSLATAAAAATIADHFPRTAREDIFTLGLLAGIGQLAFACVHAEMYDRILSLGGDDEPADLIALEREQLLLDHLELSAALLRDWGFPVRQLEAIEELYVLRPTGSGNRRWTGQVLNLAHRLATACIAHAEALPTQVLTAMNVAEAIGIESDDFEPLLGRCVNQWQELAAVLEVPSGPPPSLPSSWTGSDAARSAAATECAVLLVEPRAAVAGLVRRMLEGLGHDVHVVGTVAEGLSHALHHQPPVVVLGWHEPSEEALGMVRTLRQTHAGQQPYLLALGLRENDAEALAALEVGVDALLGFPCGAEFLRLRMAAASRFVRTQNRLREERAETRAVLGDLAIASRRLDQTALTDALTGLPNRRAALNLLQEHFEDARANRDIATCALIDVDHFKEVNDSLGHHAGDIVLVALAGILSANAGPNAVVCRYGGEEFLVVCRRGHGHLGANLARDLCAAVAAQPIALEDRSIQVTISVGVAAFPAEETSADALIHAADNAAYAAKRRGRNQVVVSGTVLS